MKYKVRTLLKVTTYCAVVLAILRIKESEGFGVVMYALVAAVFVLYVLRDIALSVGMMLALLIFSGGIAACVGGHNFGGSVMTQPSNVLLGILIGFIVWLEALKSKQLGR